MPDHPDLAEVVRRELLLLEPTRRADGADVAGLRPEFRRHGAPAGIVVILTTEPGTPIVLTRVTVRVGADPLRA